MAVAMPTCPGCHAQFGYAEYRVHMFRCSWLRGRQTGQEQPGYPTGGSRGDATEPAIEELVDGHEHRIAAIEARLAALQEDAGDADAGVGPDGRTR